MSYDYTTQNSARLQQGSHRDFTASFYTAHSGHQPMAALIGAATW